MNNLSRIIIFSIFSIAIYFEDDNISVFDIIGLGVVGVSLIFYDSILRYLEDNFGDRRK